MGQLQCLRDSREVREEGQELELLFEKMLGYLHFRTCIWPLPTGILGKQILLLLVASKISLKKYYSKFFSCLSIPNSLASGQPGNKQLLLRPSASQPSFSI